MNYFAIAQPQWAHHGRHHSHRVAIPAKSEARGATTLQAQNSDFRSAQADWVSTGLICIALITVLILFIRSRKRRIYAPPPPLPVQLPTVAFRQPGTFRSQRGDVLDWMENIELMLGRYCPKPGDSVADWIRTALSCGLDSSSARSMQRINYQRNRLVHDRVQLSNAEWQEMQRLRTSLFGPR